MGCIGRRRRLLSERRPQLHALTQSLRVCCLRQGGSGLYSFASRVLCSNGTIFETNDTAISLVFAWGGRLHYVLPLPLSTFSPSVFECQPHPASLETWCRDNPEDCPEQCEPELNGTMLAAESGGDVVATSWPRPCQVSEARAAITN